MPAMDDTVGDIAWEADGVQHRARFLSARGGSAPKRAVAASDETTADAAFRLVSQGTALVWDGDYHNARQMLQALGRRIDRKRKPPVADEPAATFNAYRLAQAQRANLLGLLLVPLRDGRVPLRRAPDVALAVSEAIGPLAGEAVLPLRDLLAMVSAHEWRRNGVPIRALGGTTIHPHYGVFPPTRQDYVDLVAAAPLPVEVEVAFDLGTGSGVLAAVLLHRGVSRIVATDAAPRALASAADAFDRLGVADRVTLVPDRLYPDGRASLAVCNPPWLPAKAGTSLEAAVYDPDSAMLRGFLTGLGGHLLPGGEGWLIMSDLAEHLGLRAPGELAAMIAGAGLRVLSRMDAAPSPKGVRDSADPLHFARKREVVSLWRLGTSP
jgi:methylase of polypeptide subunit release factors